MRLFLFLDMKLKLHDILTEDTLRLLDVLTDESKERALSAARELYGNYDDLTLIQFLQLTEGDYTVIGIEDTERVAVGQLLWMQGFADFCTSFAAICNRMQVPESPESRDAHSGEMPLSTREGMLIFARSYFGFHTFEETANTVTVSEYIVARKDTYNTAIYNKNRADAERRKAERGRAKR